MLNKSRTEKNETNGHCSLEFLPFVSQIKAKTYEIENLEKVYLLI